MNTEVDTGTHVPFFEVPFMFDAPFNLESVHRIRDHLKAQVQ